MNFVNDTNAEREITNCSHCYVVCLNGYLEARNNYVFGQLSGSPRLFKNLLQLKKIKNWKIKNITKLTPERNY